MDGRGGGDVPIEWRGALIAPIACRAWVATAVVCAFLSSAADELSELPRSITKVQEAHQQAPQQPLSDIIDLNISVRPLDATLAPEQQHGSRKQGRRRGGVVCR